MNFFQRCQSYGGMARCGQPIENQRTKFTIGELVKILSKTFGPTYSSGFRTNQIALLSFYCDVSMKNIQASLVMVYCVLYNGGSVSGVRQWHGNWFLGMGRNPVMLER